MLDLFGLCDLVDRPRSISTPTCPDRERMSPAQEVFDVPHSKLIPVESECEIDACGTCTERKSVCRQAGANTQPGGPHRSCIASPLAARAGLLNQIEKPERFTARAELCIRSALRVFGLGRNYADKD